MRYVTIKRFKRESLKGYVNIPYGSQLERKEDGLLYFENEPVCVASSAASHEHFTRDDDGNGKERGKLTQAILEALEPQNGETREDRDNRWEIIWNDTLAQKYRKQEHQTYWLWNDDFFNAPIEDLKHIGALAKAKF
ncbi:MAG: hypothetical protein J6M62_05345 [Selenomonadaceae bacterium]|nr:hypothetical protein [Selenomonadaceae bacterium]MBP3723583.1 hypothetical protein [Selenomonadaceae bacterium]